MLQIRVRRLIEGVGIACIYGLLTKVMNYSSINDNKVKELQKYQKNLSLEGNEIIYNLQNNLYKELNIIKERTSYNSNNTYNTYNNDNTSDNNSDNSSENTENNNNNNNNQNENNENNNNYDENEFKKWVSKYSNSELPQLPPNKFHDKRINDKLRTISIYEREKLFQPNVPYNPNINLPTQKLVQMVLSQYYFLEGALFKRFVDHQYKVCHIIKSYQSSQFYQEQSLIQTLYIPALKYFFCYYFLKKTDNYFKVSNIHAASPITTNKTANLIMIPIILLTTAYSFKNIPMFDQHLVSSENNIPRKFPGVNNQSTSNISTLLPRPSFEEFLSYKPAFALKYPPLYAYSHIQPPPITLDFTKNDNYWNKWAILSNVILQPIVEGVIFRELLFNSFLKYTPRLQAHFLLSVVVIATQLGINFEKLTIHSLDTNLKLDEFSKKERELSENALDKQYSLNISYIPFIIQASFALTNSVPLTTFYHILFNLTGYFNEYVKRSDLIFTLDHPEEYQLLCKIFASLDFIYEPLANFIRHNDILSFIVKSIQKKDTNKSKNENHININEIQIIKQNLLKDIIIKYYESIDLNSNNSNNNNSNVIDENKIKLSAEDIQNILVLIRHHSSYLLFDFPLFYPPKFTDQPDRKTKLPFNFTSHKHETGYIDEIFYNDSFVSLKLFYNDILSHIFKQIVHQEYVKQQKLNHKVEGEKIEEKVDISTAISLLIDTLPNEIILDSEMRNKFQTNIFYVDKFSSESTLDLLNEAYCHNLEKILRSVDTYTLTVGAWTTMLLEGQENGLDFVTAMRSLNEYNQKLNRFVSAKSANESKYYPTHYGLTYDYFSKLLSKKCQTNQELKELRDNWESYINGEELKKKIIKNSNPFPLFFRNELYINKIDIFDHEQ